MRSRAERLTDFGLGTLAGVVFLILYAPVLIGALFSLVTVDRLGIRWETVSFDWYGKLYENQSILDAIRTTAIVGASSVALASTVAIMLALYVEWDGALFRRVVELVVYLPFLLPPIITGLSLLIFFVGVGIDRGFVTIVIGHTVFVLAVMFRLVQTRLQSLSKTLVEASYDLGASRWQTVRFVLWPQMRSAVATGAILAFTLSFDETLISVFLAGDTTTLPLRLWAMMRVGFTPEINALVTIVLLISIALTIIVGMRLNPADQRDDE
jgi:ABC-type spermidine/putrescine transport system permease subunit II